MSRAGYALVAPPPRLGARPLLENHEFRQKLLRMAAAGTSRRGVASCAGMRTAQLTDWLARGIAQPSIEPYASFAVDYLAAERAQEACIAEGISQSVALILRTAPEKRTPWQVDFLRRELATRFPVEHGNAASGTGQLRIVDGEPDPEAWWQKHGLVGDQLRALLRDPPESVAAALVAEGDAVYARLLAGGWKPPALTKGTP